MSRRTLAVLGALLAAAAAVTGGWIRQGRPVDMVAAPGDRVQCVSYAPSSRRDETLVDPGVIVPPERIEADLAVLAQHVDCVRTYSQSNGLAEVPRIAGRHGLKVLMGVWLGRDAVTNEREIASALAMLARDGDTIEGVVVGNEVLLRGELSPAALRGYIERVAAATDKPVTYADVWEFWRRYRADLEGAVDFVTFHVLPYWEDEPVAVDAAVAHVRDIHALMAREFPGRELLIGETGWPSAGRQRHGAVPGQVNQARFIRGFLDFAAGADVRYNIIEAFDQPWKRRQEGAVGGYWGLYDNERRAKFPLVGPVVEEPRWLLALAAGGACALVFWFAGWMSGGARRVSSTVILLLAGYVAGCVLAAQAKTLWQASRTAFEWTIGGAFTALALVTAGVAAMLLARGDGESGTLWRRLRFVWLYGATIVSLLLVLDSRYRDFPLALFVLPVAGFGLLALDPRFRAASTLEERLMAGWLLAAAALTPMVEGADNVRALAWAVSCAGFGAVVLAAGGRQPVA